MKYLCLIYQDEKVLEALSGREWDALASECQAYSEELRSRGHYLGGEALQPVLTATTLRARGGKLSMTDGPFAETREQLAGFYLLEARDLNEALQLAARIPPARLGGVEVRPVRERPAF
ncbi:MAG TPA: YciI family protein [Pseudomonas sp.]|nr:YciI family protein [Pseudomonas sp.]